MMTNDPITHEEQATLDPPGTIAVVGAGPLGIEAALYGRYLGYKVTLFEAVAVGHSLAGQTDDPIPMMPDRCASPLARAALSAQAGGEMPTASPMLIGEWMNQIWLPLTQSDLLRGRLRCPLRVTAIELAELESDPDEQVDDDETGEPVPPDFRLTFDDGQSEDFEAVILATGHPGGDGDVAGIDCRFPVPADYLFLIGGSQPGQPAGCSGEESFWSGLKQIVSVYASLGGRMDLDLYRPARG